VSLIKRIVLVGLPGAGKSTVGALVAAELGWRFVDLDTEIERAAGMSVSQIFAAKGEGEFRRLERMATATLADSGGLVLAPGGGWMADQANREALGARSTVVYLSVAPEVAATRLTGSEGTRPLIAGADGVGALKKLLAAREAAYLQANHTVTVDSMTPSEAASIIVALVLGGERY
jgi:shikimate kinase